jgi:hypothetical protein
VLRPRTTVGARWFRGNGFDVKRCRSRRLQNHETNLE